MGRVLLAFVAAGAAVCGVAAAAGPWDGIYRQSANGICEHVGAQGGAIKIEDSIFYGVGIACRMTRPVDVLDMDATLYTMECVDGNGEDADHWSERVMMMRDAQREGVIMVWNGYALRHERCDMPPPPPPEPAPQPEAALEPAPARPAAVPIVEQPPLIETSQATPAAH
ncbi:hypothetical protein [Ketogulonicigenium vulgare]|uniref:hypothetical protein n=1 Tax=Ketogulonicigenium vulgare TaxID=92945 RepID=UPI002358355F|nr:hypothetical protein [Ketogulonicigenium vulgare]